MIRLRLLGPLLAALLAALVCAAGAGAEPGGSVHAGPDYHGGKPLPLASGTLSKARLAGRKAAGRIVPRAVGDRQLWPASDDVSGETYVKYFTLLGVGQHVEVWVASDSDAVSRNLEFPAGDCRNDERVQLSEAQVQSLIAEFDSNIYPKEAATFSVPPARDGSRATLPEELGLPADYFAGEPGDVVVLVDNVRDASFYDTDNAGNLPYVAGFFFSVFSDLVDRNVMTIDGYDWLHRTGASPPDEPVPGDNCRSKPARPYNYEGTFAHEYQHLLEASEDPDETAWLNEGLSDYAQVLTGYVDLASAVTEAGFDSHVQCFLGNLGIQTGANPNPRKGGPENSLTLWGDQGDTEILCDYGAAASLMQLLAGRYGTGFMSELHRDDAHGLASVQRLVGGVASRRDAREAVHDWLAAMALDGAVDRGASLDGGAKARYTAPGLDASVNWDVPDTASSPGAPPNGADFVRLRDRAGRFLGAGEIRSLVFEGAPLLRPDPVEWTVDADPPGQTGDPALASGSGPDLDRALVGKATVPKRNAVLSFDTLYDAEAGFDYGFVQVSTDGGRTYRSLANDATAATADPQAIQEVVDNLPGLTGASGGGDVAAWVRMSFDLSAYRGKTVLLAFRYVTDAIVDEPGWWIEDVRVGGAALTDGSSLAGWRSATEVRPVPVAGFTVQLVGYTTDGPASAFVYRLRLDRRFHSVLGERELSRILRSKPDVVAALVTYDEPTESIAGYAPYRLRVNGVTQPGG